MSPDLDLAKCSLCGTIVPLGEGQHTADTVLCARHISWLKATGMVGKTVPLAPDGFPCDLLFVPQQQLSKQGGTDDARPQS